MWIFFFRLIGGADFFINISLDIAIMIKFYQLRSIIQVSFCGIDDLFGKCFNARISSVAGCRGMSKKEVKG